MSTAITQPIEGPAVWHGEELARSPGWVRPVTPRFVEELDAALRAVERRGLRWPGFGPADFRLPTVAGELAAVRHELERGRGIVLLRGLPVERYTLEQLRQLSWGLGVHLGTPRPQNASGELIGEVRDEVRLYGEVRETPGASSITRSSRARRARVPKASSNLRRAARSRRTSASRPSALSGAGSFPIAATIASASPIAASWRSRILA